jgi:hypothetical protein
MIGGITPVAQAQTSFVPQSLKAYSSDTNYMSIPGYLRWINYVKSGEWNCQGMVKLGERYIDDQNGDPEAISGMDIKTVTPEKVSYTLQMNDGAILNLPYDAQAVHRKGIAGAVINVNWKHLFCIGPQNHYVFTLHVTPDGLMDRVGNEFTFREGTPRNGKDSAEYHFHLEYGQDGNLLVVDEIGFQKFQINFDNGIFYIPLLASTDESVTKKETQSQHHAK